MLDRAHFSADGTYTAGLNGSFKATIQNKTSVLQKYAVYINSDGQRYTRSSGWISPFAELELHTFHLKAGDVLGYTGEASSLHAWVSILQEETAISAYGGKAEVVHAANGVSKRFTLPTGVAARSKDEINLYIAGVKLTAEDFNLISPTEIEFVKTPFECAQIIIDVIRIA